MRACDVLVSYEPLTGWALSGSLSFVQRTDAPDRHGVADNLMRIGVKRRGSNETGVLDGHEDPDEP
jgi:hypothetical protein